MIRFAVDTASNLFFNKSCEMVIHSNQDGKAGRRRAFPHVHFRLPYPYDISFNIQTTNLFREAPSSDEWMTRRTSKYMSQFSYPSEQPSTA